MRLAGIGAAILAVTAAGTGQESPHPERVPREGPESVTVPDLPDRPGPDSTPKADSLGGGPTVYTPADLARFAPRTALEMVQQIPGFVIREGGGGRGLGQGGDNVLINGKRASGKSNDAVTALGRIPADAVARIEILDGTTLDIPGLSGQVVNVVAVTDGLSGQFRYAPQFRFRRVGPRLREGGLSLNGRKGAVGFVLAVDSDSFRGGNNGPERVLAPDGTLIDFRDEDARFNSDTVTLSAALDYESPGGLIANLDGAYTWFDRRNTEISQRTGLGQPDRVRDFLSTEDEFNYEISGDVEFGLFGGRLKLIGFNRFERSPTVNQTITVFADDSPADGTRFARVADEGESIGRAEYGWSRPSGADWQLAVEGAFNFLDVGSADLAVLDATGAFVPEPLEGASSRVEEWRGEATGSHNRPLAADWTLQTSLGAEISTIRQSGPLGQTRTFVRPKGLASLVWTPERATDLSLRLERRVGQLSFFDFVASVNVNQENQNVSNPDLVPPQEWRLDLELTRRLGPWGSINARLAGRWFEDLIDQVPIGETGEAPGNISGGRRFGFIWTSTTLFDPLGARGLRLDVDGQYLINSVIDPLFGTRRPISDANIWEVDATLRHDIPGTDLAYGVSYDQTVDEQGFRLDEVNFGVSRPGDLGVFFEHKDVFGLTLNVSFFNLIDQRDDFERTVFENRRDGPEAFSEDRSRDFGRIVRIGITGTF